MDAIRTGMIHVRAAAVAALGGLALALPLSGQTLLRLVPPEGQVSRYVLSMEVNVENPMMPVSGPAMTARVHQTSTVLSVTDEATRMRTSIDSSSMMIAMPGAGAAPDLAGTVFAVETDARGRLVSVVAEETAGAATAEVAEGLMQGSGFFWLPEAEVAAGDTWSENAPVPLSLGGPVQTVDVGLTYTLDGMEGDRATITFAGPIETTLDMGGMPANMAGELTGSMVVDLAAGRFVSQESRLDIEMALGGMAIPFETTTTVELVTNS